MAIAGCHDAGGCDFDPLKNYYDHMSCLLRSPSWSVLPPKEKILQGTKNWADFLLTINPFLVWLCSTSGFTLREICYHVFFFFMSYLRLSQPHPCYTVATGPQSFVFNVIRMRQRQLWPHLFSLCSCNGLGFHSWRMGTIELKFLKPFQKCAHLTRHTSETRLLLNIKECHQRKSDLVWEQLFPQTLGGVGVQTWERRTVK